MFFEIASYQEKILKWFESNGRHNLPWQDDFEPYKILVSEVMLQQTQVTTVIPYFMKFIEAFPNIISLSICPEDKLMSYWSGLGYYRRASNLKKAAVKIIEDFQGSVPNNLKDLLSLPGIGLTTANAILSISFGESAPILDGNVIRIFSRMFMIQGPYINSKIQKSLWKIAYKLIPNSNTQKYTQSQMDLGSTICTRNKPKCTKCPINKFCLSYINNSVDSFPTRKNRIVKRIVKKNYYIYFFKKEFLVVKNSSSGFWPNLYVLPEFLLNKEHVTILCENVTHMFTHIKLCFNISFYKLNEKKSFAGFQWICIDRFNDYGFPAPIKKKIIFFINNVINTVK